MREHLSSCMCAPTHTNTAWFAPWGKGMSADVQKQFSGEKIILTIMLKSRYKIAICYLPCTQK